MYSAVCAIIKAELRRSASDCVLVFAERRDGEARVCGLKFHEVCKKGAARVGK